MRKFKTESKKLLDLMINSIYTNREIFLRELISNASDAVDKLYFRSLTDPSVAVGRDDLAITVGYNSDERTVTVSDNGIGMTKDELDKNLGPIPTLSNSKLPRPRPLPKASPARRRASTTSPMWTSSASSASVSTPPSWWARRCASSPAPSARMRPGPGSPTASTATTSSRPSAPSMAPTSSCT